MASVHLSLPVGVPPGVLLRDGVRESDDDEVGTGVDDEGSEGAGVGVQVINGSPWVSILVFTRFGVVGSMLGCWVTREKSLW